MDAGIADTLNRQIARRLAARLDHVDQVLGFTKESPWYRAPLAATLMNAGTGGTTTTDAAWLVGSLLVPPSAARDGLNIETYPADGDWDNLFSNIRAEIEARRTRDPETPPAKAAETQLS